MAETVICYFIFLCLSSVFLHTSCQKMEVRIPADSSGICNGSLYKSAVDLKQGLDGCVVIVGSLEIMIERGTEEDFIDTAFYNLREITDYLVIYRVKGLESLSQLFPSLTRIRGNKLLNNFALVVYDNQNLNELGLFNLLKIDRGGVIVWGEPQPCFVETVDWNALAPKARHVLSFSERQIQCGVVCSCTLNRATNHCWNNKKCQTYVEGPDALPCHEQCLGCRKTRNDTCFTCRHYTHNFTCVSKCPSDTIIFPDNKYCITTEECHDLGRIVWNNTCVAGCPIDFKLSNKTCKPCTHCEMNCSSLVIHSMASIQKAERCVYVNGPLTIHLRAIPDAMADLKTYLGKIQEISGYLSIEASDVITSLDFLTSLRTIKGKVLKDNKYSVFINHNINLQMLFRPNVTKNLVIGNGKALFDDNPVLCMNYINEIKGKFPTASNDLDIPVGTNGYRGGCLEVRFNFSIRAINETSVNITFPIENHNIHYSALYVRLPPGVHSTVVPESCSQFEWHDADVFTNTDENITVVKLDTLLPASNYALCVEIYDPEKKILSRSNIVNFTTLVGKPQPPFFIELVASASDIVVLRWVDHKDYIDHIKYYRLDVTLIEMQPRTETVDYCKCTEDFFEVDDIRHAFVWRPPPEYKRGCESMCGILKSATPGAMVEDYFDVCDDEDIGCNNDHKTDKEYNNDLETNSDQISNTTVGSFVRTLSIQISAPRNNYQVAGLAPFSDYRFGLRACTNDRCSRSSQKIVRTFRSIKADIPTILNANADTLGMVTVKWKPPEVSNGPVLTYNIEVLPKINVSNLIPQVWCVAANNTEIVVKSVIASEYVVWVCLRTLATSPKKKTCSKWMKAIVTAVPTQIRITSKMDLMWSGVLFGGLICVASLIVGWCKNRNVGVRSDVVPLVDSSSSNRVESEAPALLMSDFVPFQTIALD